MQVVNEFLTNFETRSARQSLLRNFKGDCTRTRGAQTVPLREPLLHSQTSFYTLPCCCCCCGRPLGRGGCASLVHCTYYRCWFTASFSKARLQLSSPGHLLLIFRVHIHPLRVVLNTYSLLLMCPFLLLVLNHCHPLSLGFQRPSLHLGHRCLALAVTVVDV